MERETAAGAAKRRPVVRVTWTAAAGSGDQPAAAEGAAEAEEQAAAKAGEGTENAS